MARIAFVLADDFEDPEFQVPHDRLKDAGHDLVVIGTERGATLTGKQGESTATVDATTDEVDPSEFDALVIPGGYSPDKLRTNADIVEFTRKLGERDVPVAAICHAGSLLIEARMVEGKRLTSWPSIKLDLVNAGADWVDEEVVVDGNLITSRKPDDLDAFVSQLTDMLATDTDS